MKPTILALDLEGTLISNAISQIPRPGLYRFLEEVQTLFDQLTMFTTVPEDRFRSIAALLAREGSAPAWFVELPYIRWSGKTKDLRLASPNLGEQYYSMITALMSILGRSTFGSRSRCSVLPIHQTMMASAWYSTVCLIAP
jgi:hypothetical protein